MSIIGVLTGDIVRSTRLKPEQKVRIFEALDHGRGLISNWSGMEGISPVARHRGDGWQIILTQPYLSLRVLLCLRACLRAAETSAKESFETRAFIGLGTSDTLYLETPGSSDGQAFTLSGHGLDALKPPHLFGLDYLPKGPSTFPALSALVSLCDAVSRRWTQKQAHYLVSMLAPDPPTQKALLARRGSISPSTLNQHLTQGGLYALLDALSAFELFFMDQTAGKKSC